MRNRIFKNLAWKPLAAVLVVFALLAAFAPAAAHAGPVAGVSAQENGEEDVVYVVRPGDTLSHIAVSFETTVPALLNANPGIFDPNIIYPGQEIVVPGADGDPRLAVIAPTNGPAGTPVDLRAEGFNANVPVEIGVGPEDSEFTVAFDTTTDSQGELDTTVMIPGYADINEDWVVVIRLENDPSVKEISNSFRVTDADGAADFDEGVVYLIAVEDERASGEFIGCEDSVVPTEVDIDPNGSALRQSLQELLALDYRRSPDGLYNALYPSDLAIDELSVEDGQATIRLAGDLSIAGTCDTPRLAAQIAETAAQYGWVDTVSLFINDQEFDIPGETLTYVIQPGDTLSEIAVSFGLEIEDLLEENPQITNPSFIVSNTELAIPQAEAEVEQPVIILAPTNGDPGTTVLVEATGLFPGQDYTIGVGPQDSEYDSITTVTSDENGRISVEVAIPSYADPGDRWVVILSPVDENRVEVSNLFLVTE